MRRREWFRGRWCRWIDLSSGAMLGDVEKCWATATHAGRTARQRLVAALFRRLYIELQRAGLPGTERYVGDATLPGGEACTAGGGDPPGAVQQAEDLKAHARGCALPRLVLAADKRRPRDFYRTSTARPRRRCAPISRGAPRTRSRSRGCSPTVQLARTSCRFSRRPRA